MSTSRVSREPLSVPYLMLVTFGAPHLAELTRDHLSAFERWPYDGVAVSVLDACDVSPVPSAESLASRIGPIEAASAMHIWPWVFLNRIIGRGPNAAPHELAPVKEYFRRIRGWDFDDEVGARTDFLQLWRLGLRFARTFGAPGVVLDLEAYNDSCMYFVGHVAAARNESAEQVIAAVESLGAEMATILAEEYPNAVVWSLFLDLGSDRTTYHLIRGFLAEVEARDLPATLVEGGELAVGYYAPSTSVLEQRLAAQSEGLRPWTDRHGDRLRPAGTIAPYHEPERITWWIKEESERHGHIFANAEEFRPHFRTLFASRDYVWLYGAIAAHFDPFAAPDETSTSAIHAVVADELSRARRSRSGARLS